MEGSLGLCVIQFIYIENQICGIFDDFWMFLFRFFPIRTKIYVDEIRFVSMFIWIVHEMLLIRTPAVMVTRVFTFQLQFTMSMMRET